MARLFVAIPAMNESEFLPHTLYSLSLQDTSTPFEIVVCVNQPEDYWDDQRQVHICRDNAATLAILRNFKGLPLHVIDCSSRGNGWKQGKGGVGMARKTLFNSILQVSNPNDIIVSLDADTVVSPSYLQSICDNFASDRRITAIALPYYHKIDDCSELQARALLRYEIYMRNYLLNLLKINSPYAFTALGSAIAVRTDMLKKIGNITPYKSGEDFYLLQKIAKMGGLTIFNTECAYPSPRPSDRVPFGTGPAVNQGIIEKSTSYPIFHHTYFEPMEEAYRNLENLYKRTYTDEDNEFLLFLKTQNKGLDIWEKIRSNVSDFEHFRKAFHQKADGLRILQFIRQQHRKHPSEDTEALRDNLLHWYPDAKQTIANLDADFNELSSQKLNTIRNFLFSEEMKLRSEVIFP